MAKRWLEPDDVRLVRDAQNTRAGAKAGRISMDRSLRIRQATSFEEAVTVANQGVERPPPVSVTGSVPVPAINDSTGLALETPARDPNSILETSTPSQRGIESVRRERTLPGAPEEPPKIRPGFTDSVTAAARLIAENKALVFENRPEIWLSYAQAMSEGYTGDLGQWIAMACWDFWAGRGLDIFPAPVPITPITKGPANNSNGSGAPDANGGAPAATPTLANDDGAKLTKADLQNIAVIVAQSILQVQAQQARPQAATAAS